MPDDANAASALQYQNLTMPQAPKEANITLKVRKVFLKWEA